MAYGLLLPKNPDLSHKYFPRYSVSNLQFFSENLRSLSLIAAIAKYIYCQNQKLLRVLSQMNLSFNFEYFSQTMLKLILIFCHICQKGNILYRLFCDLFFIDHFSKYLQFPLNTMTYFQNYVNENVYLEDNCP